MFKLVNYIDMSGYVWSTAFVVAKASSNKLLFIDELSGPVKVERLC